MKIAIIDIGTNSVRMLITDKRLHSLSEDTYVIATRLGQGLVATGFLDGVAMKRTVKALIELKAISQDKGVEKTLVIATSAVREADNKNEFLNLVYRETGWAVEVISGEEEAALGYVGVTKGLAAVPRDPLVIDIGGGSTELIWSSGGKVIYTSSLVGAVTMTERKASSENIKNVLSPVLHRVGSSGFDTAIGIGGTATTLAAISLNLENYNPNLVHGHRLSKETVLTIYNRLMKLSAEQRRQVKGLQPERADIILAGILILTIIVEELELKEIVVSETDIMYGLAYRFFNLK